MIVRSTSDSLLTQLVQLALHAQGLYLGAIDGQYGPITESAYEAYSDFNRYWKIGQMQIRLSPDQTNDMALFKTHYLAFASTYMITARLADIPPELLAALHWRESSGDFNTYLHNGDPLGKKVTDEPLDVPLFTEWTPAAVDAIQREKRAREASRINQDCRNLSAMCIFAEHFNGMGYANRPVPVPDPYVLAGTTGYVSGKYVSDHVYDPNVIDKQLGILPMIREIMT